jgi:uncharacterized protein YehS (DUF1456 family)
MTHNDALRSLRHILNINDAKFSEIFALGGCVVSPAETSAYLESEEAPGYKECTHATMAHFLNGLVIFKRGRDSTKPSQPLEPHVTNNIILKKVRVAFQLKDEDLTKLFAKVGMTVSKTEMSAFFRSRDHRNYRNCGDQMLRNLLKGLAS